MFYGGGGDPLQGPKAGSRSETVAMVRRGARFFHSPAPPRPSPPRGLADVGRIAAQKPAASFSVHKWKLRF